MSGLGWFSNILLLSLCFICSAPARAYPGETSDYLYCRVELPVAGQTWQVTRTLSKEGGFAFQTSDDPPGKALLSSKKEAFIRAFLVWRKTAEGKQGQVRLWVNSDDWIFAYPDESHLYAHPLKGKADSELELGRRMDKQGYHIFEIDPQTLLDQFAGLDAVALVIHPPGKKAKSGQFAPPKGQINLALLRAQLAAVKDADAALERERGVPGACKSVQPSGFEEADIANWTWCVLNLPAVPGGGPGVWSDGHRLMSGLQVGKNGYLGFQSDIGDGKEGHPFLTKGLSRLGHFNLMRFSAHVYAKDQRLTLTSGSETLTFDIKAHSGGTALTWADLMRLDATGHEIRYHQAYNDGKLLGEGSIPAGSFRAMEAQMQDAYRRILDMRKDPITHCSPPPPIIVT
jgi:hypothetical protein